eukprot:6378115-Amphidinium_carterae.1
MAVCDTIACVMWSLTLPGYRHVCHTLPQPSLRIGAVVAVTAHMAGRSARNRQGHRHRTETGKP